MLCCNVSNVASPHQPSIKCILFLNMHRLVIMEKIDTFYDFKIWLITKEYGISYTQKAHILITLKLYKLKCHIFYKHDFSSEQNRYRFWWDVESYKTLISYKLFIDIWLTEYTKDTKLGSYFQVLFLVKKRQYRIWNQVSHVLRSDKIKQCKEACTACSVIHVIHSWG